MNSSVDQVEGGQVEDRVPEAVSVAAQVSSERLSPHAIPGMKYGWLSHLRSYLILDPLIWFYTMVMGLLALPGGMFDRDGFC